MARKLGSHPLSPYEELLDLCAKRKYVVELDWSRYGWQLEIFDKGESVGRGMSTKPVPQCFRELAANAAAGLSRSGRAKP